MKSLALFAVAVSLSAAGPDYARDVQPILHRCSGCHSAANPQGGLQVLSRAKLLEGGKNGPAVIAGKGSESLLIKRVTGEVPPRMPLNAPPLKAEEIAILRDWINAGAPGTANAEPEWKPPMEHRSVAVPTGRHPVDALLGTESNQTVSDNAFARRAYLDVWGLLPTPEQLAQFGAMPGPDKRARLIDQLLANRRYYAEHWISFWNDLLHNDEGVTYIGDRKSITPWLLKALESNMPYDRFVRALVNPKSPEDPEGFLMGVNWRGDINASQTPVMQAAQNSAQVFLGVNLKCNSCHDSFISRWKLTDAYGMASLFSDGPLEIYRCDVKTGQVSKPAFLFPELGPVDGDTREARRQAAADLFTSPRNGRMARTFVNRVWKQLMGRGIVESVDDLDARPWNPDLLDWLAADFAKSGYDTHRLLKMIMTSRAYQSAAGDGRTKPAPRRLSAEQFADAISQMTGEWRVRVSNRPGPGVYSREWGMKSSALTRALGRPLRDTAVTERVTDPATLQALELVNGDTLATLVANGARRLLNQARKAPQNLFDSGVVGAGKTVVDVDITGMRELYLVVEDWDSYDPPRVIAGWGDVEVSGAEGSRKLGEASFETRDAKFPNSLIVRLPSEVRIDLAGRSFTRLRATASVAKESSSSDISPRIRFFVFGEKPDRKQLVRVEGEPPVTRPPQSWTPHTLITYLYQHALGRNPTVQERAIAREMVGGTGLEVRAEGLEDLIWALVMSPEFQFIT